MQSVSSDWFAKMSLWYWIEHWFHESSALASILKLSIIFLKECPSISWCLNRSRAYSRPPWIQRPALGPWWDTETTPWWMRLQSSVLRSSEVLPILNVLGELSLTCMHIYDKKTQIMWKKVQKQENCLYVWIQNKLLVLKFCVDFAQPCCDNL